MDGGIRSLGVMAAVEVLHEKRQSTHSKERHWH